MSDSQANALALQSTPLPYSDLVHVICRSVRSKQSARAYARDLDDWAAWCAENYEVPSAPHFTAVENYLSSLVARGLSRSTLQRRLSVLRKLARVAAILDGGDIRQRAAEGLMLLQVQMDDSRQQVQRDRRALTPAAVDRALRAWGADTAQAKRNRAMIAVGFCTAARRSEIAALRWDDINLETGVVHIRHGKGNKTRDAGVYGELAIKALRAWKDALDNEGPDRQFVFPRIRKGDRIDEDTPITTDGVYYVVKETCRRTGEEFKPHDMRRTFITEALATGTPLADVQAQAGHADGSMTLHYAQATDAENRRKRGQLRYG